MIPGFVLADATWSGPLSAPGPAAVGAAGSLPAPPVDAGFSASLLAPLALISLALIAVLLVLRYLRLSRSPSQAGLLSVVAQTALSPQHTVYLVQVAERYLLLGGAPGGLSLLTEVPASRLPSQPAKTAPRGRVTADPTALDDDDDLDEDLPPMAGRPPPVPSLIAEPPRR